MKKTFMLGFLALTLMIAGCSSDKPQNNFGPLGSTHNHADIKIYMLGNALDFSVPQYQVMDKLVHFESRDGDVIHTHAVGVNLGFLLETVGMNLESECFTTDSGNKYCNSGKAQLKVFVKRNGADWDQAVDPANYVIFDLDKILINFGTQDEEELRELMDKVTDKARTY